MITSRNGKLYVDDKEVIYGWQSYNDWFWLVTTYNIDNPEKHYGYIQTHVDGWGAINAYDLSDMGPIRVWRIPVHELQYAGRR